MSSITHGETSLPKRFIRLREVLRMIGLSKSSIYVLIKKDQFPPPIKLAGRASAWREDEVVTWMNDRLVASR